MASVAKREWTYKGTTKTAWIVRYEHEGKHRQATFKLKKEADAFRQKVEREKFEDVHVAAREGMTVNDVADRYLRSEEDRLKSGQISRSYFEQVRIFVEVGIMPYLGHRKFHELTGGDIEDWVHRLCRERGMGIRQAKRRLGELSRMAEYAIDRKALRRNPVPGIYRRLRGIPKVQVSMPTVEQVTAILAAADERQPGKQRHAHLMFRAMLPLAVMCGLRVGEIIGLQMKHLHLDERYIEVRTSLTRFGELKGPKTSAGVRDVPLPEYAVVRLREYIRHRHENEHDLVFTTYNAKMLHPGTLRQNYWWPLLKSIGLFNEADPFHFHALRHFASSWMIHNGIPLTDTASLLGHKHFDVTLQTYAHPLIGGQKRAQAFDRMSEALVPAPAETGAVLPFRAPERAGL